MAFADTQKLIVDLSLQGNFTPGLKAARGELSTFGGAVAKIEAVSGRVSVAAGKLGGAFSHAGSQLKNLITGPLGLAGLGIGLFSVGGALEKGIDKARDFGDEVRKMAAVSGLSTETTSALSAALDHFNIASDKSLRLVGFLEKNVGLLAARKDGIASFQKTFGLALTDANGHLKDANELILTTADYFNNKSIPATTKAAALAKLYGRSWQDLVPFLAAGRKGIADAEEEAAKLGLTLKSQDIDALVAMKKATRDWGDALGGLELQIGLALVPALTSLAKSATSFVSDNRAGIVQFFKDGVKFAGEFGDVIRTSVVPVFSAIKGAWEKLPKPFRDLLVTGLVADRTVKFLFGFSPIKFAADSITSALSKALGGVVGSALASAGLGKLFVQPVFVTNQGFGPPGGGGGGKPSEGGKSSDDSEPSKPGFNLPAIGAAISVTDVLTEIKRGNTALLEYVRTHQAEYLAQGVTQAQLDQLLGGGSGGVFGKTGVNQFGQVIGEGLTKSLQKSGFTQSQRQIEAAQQALLHGQAGLGSNLAGIGPSTGRAVGDALRHPLDALHRDLQENLKTLRHATDPARVAAAAKRVQRDVEKGAGSVAGSERIIHDLMRQLRNTHDPQLQSVLRAAIHTVEAKLPNRRFVEGQLTEAKKILASSEGQKKKLSDLKAVQERLLSHGDSHAAAQIAKLRQIAAKKTEFTVNTQVNVTSAVSIASFESKQKVLSRYTTSSSRMGIQ